MTALQVTLLTLYAFGMAVGQMLFKSTADRIAANKIQTFADCVVRCIKLTFDPIFMLAIVLYMAMTVLWIWILSFTPLSRAYPFVALAFVFTIAMGVFFFREAVTGMQLFGLASILLGIVIISRG
jgi:drug/metabolite transporter (DMT)-like permease